MGMQPFGQTSNGDRRAKARAASKKYQRERRENLARAKAMFT